MTTGAAEGFGLDRLGAIRSNGAMKVISLQSGSNGNCLCVQAAGATILLDAGISGKRAHERLAAAGVDIRHVDAMFISHDHADHVSCAGIYQRKFGVPMHITGPTLEAARRRRKLGKLGEVIHFRAGDVLHVGDARIETIPTTHDGADGVGFVITDGRRRLGVLTDLGTVFDELPDVIASLDAVIVESNYDPHMLESGPYPWFLKQRISGSGGHLANNEAAALVADSAGERLQWVCLAHLSEDNNRPDLARACWGDIVGDDRPVHVAGRYEPTRWFEVVG
jgi:phosphoribosyl 1,2-cyclic phosphodiesterase